MESKNDTESVDSKVLKTKNGLTSYYRNVLYAAVKNQDLGKKKNQSDY